MDSIDPYQGLVANIYMSYLGIEDGLNLMEIDIQGKTVIIASKELPSRGGEQFRFVGSLGLLGDELAQVKHLHQFIMVSTSKSIEVEQLLAGVNHYDRCVSPLGYGHSIPLSPSSLLKRLGYSHCLVLDPDVYGPFEGLNKARLPVLTTFFSVFPMTEEEIRVKQEQGLEALLDYWDESGKDVLEFPV